MKKENTFNKNVVDKLTKLIKLNEKFPNKRTVLIMYDNV